MRLQNTCVIVDQCVFTGGAGSFSAINIGSTGEAVFSQCLMFDNSNTAVLKADETQAVTAINCTIVDSPLATATTLSGKIDLRNCILEGGFLGDVAVSTSLLPVGGGDNLAGSATFVDVAGGDYRLVATFGPEGAVASLQRDGVDAAADEIVVLRPQDVVGVQLDHRALEREPLAHRVDERAAQGDRQAGVGGGPGGGLRRRLGAALDAPFALAFGGAGSFGGAHVRRRRDAARPLVVAAALGMLGPAALVEEEQKEERKYCASCDCEAAELACSSIDDAPSPEDFARVEAEWRAAVIKLDADLAITA